MSAPAVSDLLDILALRAKAHHHVQFANCALVRRDWSDPAFVAGRAALDGILVALARAKWRLGVYDGTYHDLVAPDRSASVLDEAVAELRHVVAASDALTRELAAGRVTPAAPPEVARAEGEVLYSRDVPLVPSICPVVVLKGSNREMGRQYAKQVIEIYGRWIFAEQARRTFTEAERREIATWKAELARHTPDVLQFARGWAEGATACGVPMSEDHAVAIFTGTRPPADRPAPLGFGFTDGDEGDASMAAYLGMARQKDPVGEDLCSGICAWGQATTDGKLVAGATGDHDVTYEATIVAFPDDGHAYIYTPFSANGSIPMLGQHFMAGHPGFNSRGMAYVHHAGANTGEPVEQWGYGVRRGPMIFRALQHAEDARTACDHQMEYPVGDTAISVGSGNGLFADDREGFAVECRTGAPTAPQPIVRTHTYDAYGKPFDFLYANNNALDPRSGHLNAPPPAGYSFSLAGGWSTCDPAALDARGGGAAMRRKMAKSSEARNRYAYRMMMEGYGSVNLDYMTMVYRQNGEVKEGDIDELQARYDAGEQWDSSVAGRHNAHVAIIKPSAEGGGIYRGCISAASRSAEPKDPGHGYILYDETNTFWELRLKDSPEEVAATAGAQAEADLAAATALFDALPAKHAGRGTLRNFLDIAQESIARGRECLAAATTRDKDAEAARMARAARRFTIAQVRARQVIEAIEPPPATLEDFRARAGAGAEGPDQRPRAGEPTRTMFGR